MTTNKCSLRQGSSTPIVNALQFSSRFLSLMQGPQRRKVALKLDSRGRGPESPENLQPAKSQPRRPAPAIHRKVLVFVRPHVLRIERALTRVRQTRNCPILMFLRGELVRLVRLFALDPRASLDFALGRVVPSSQLNRPSRSFLGHACSLWRRSCGNDALEAYVLIAQPPNLYGVTSISQLSAHLPPLGVGSSSLTGLRQAVPALESRHGG